MILRAPKENKKRKNFLRWYFMICHSRAGGNPGLFLARFAWIPAFAGMTTRLLSFFTSSPHRYFQRRSQRIRNRIFITFLLFVSFVVNASLSCSAAALPTFAAVKQKRTVSEALLLDRHGELIHELRGDPTGRRLDWKALGEISPTLVKAVIQSEDRRFYEHRGVDWFALGSSFMTNLFSTHPRGASTISMQLASILQGRRAQARRDWREKWRQIQVAREIERSWTKDEILEAYLNLISYRGELQGVAAAAQGLFAKEPHGLDDADAWILAALIRSPNAAAEKVAARA